jgi:hypothetical protein
MPQRQSSKQKATVERVMHEFKEGELRIRGTGPKVRNPKQAVAIALHEAGASNRESPAKNDETLRRTKGKERRGETAEAEKEGKRAQDRTLAKGARGGKETKGSPRAKATGGAGRSKAELYAEAKRRDIPGRSRMSKDALQRAGALTMAPSDPPRPEPTPAEPNPAPARPPSPQEDPQPAEPVGIPAGPPSESPRPAPEPGIPATSPPEIPTTPPGPVGPVA